MSANAASSRGSRVGSRAIKASRTRLAVAQLKMLQEMLQEEQKIKTREQEEATAGDGKAIA